MRQIKKRSRINWPALITVIVVLALFAFIGTMAIKLLIDCFG